MRIGPFGSAPTTWQALITSVVGVTVTLGVLAPSNAGILLNPIGAGLGSASVAFQGGTSVFENPAVGFGPIALSNVIIEKAFDSVSPIVFDNVAYAAGDLNFGGGFRWTERIHNDSGAAWTGYQLKLSETDGTWFSDLPTFTPGLVTINGGGAVSTISGANTVVRIPGDGVISANQKELRFFFSTPIASDSYFDIHSAIEGLPSSGSFELAQAPLAIPEPSTIIIWSLLGALTITVGWWRRRWQ